MARVTGRRKTPGDLPGQGLKVATGGGDEFGTQEGAHAGQAADYRCVSVIVEPGFDERVEFGDLLVEGLHALGDAGDHGGREARAV